MFGFLIIACCTAGGIMIAFIVGIFSMLHSGKWTLPGTDQRRIQHEKVELEIAEIRTKKLQAELFQTQVRGNLNQEYDRMQRELGP